MIDPTDFSAFFNQQPQMNVPRPNLRFYTEGVNHPGKSAEAGRPVYVDRDMVEIQWPGSRDTVAGFAEDKAKKDQFIAFAYAKWKETRIQPESGTPIAEVPFLMPSQVKNLLDQGVKSLESLANLSDEQAGRVAFDGLVLRDKAQKYMQAAKDSALVTRMQDQLAQRDRDIAAMREQISTLNARFEAAAKVPA